MIFPSRSAFFRILGLVAVVVPPLAVMLGWAPGSLCLVSLFACLLWLFWSIRARAAGVMLVFVAAAFATSVLSEPVPNLGSADPAGRDTDDLASEWAGSNDFRSDRPIVIHIVLDEMASTGAMTDDLGGGNAVRQALYTSAAAHGMRIFDSVYSRRYYSGVALPNLMNAEFEGRTDVSQLTSEIQTDVEQNAYFAEMARRGYHTAVFQTAVMDFCKAPDVRLCQTFQSFDPAEGARTGRSMRDRVLNLSETLLRVYEPGYISKFGLGALSDVFGISSGDARVNGAAGRYDPQGFVAWFGHFAAFVERVPRGTHVYAHFLVPHAPYLLSQACAVGGTVSTGYSLASQVPDKSARRSVRLRHYSDYLDQVACVGRKVDELLDRLEGIETFRDATIVIHGDHGSRISNGFQWEDLEPRDLIDNYATYFAIKTPGLQPGTDCEFTSLPQIFRRFMNTGASGLPDQGPPLPVLVATRASEGARVEVPMPRFGCAADAMRE